MKKFLIVLIINIAILMTLSAQEFKDCDDLLVLCGEAPFRIESSEGVGINDPSVENSCVQQEFNSVWIELNISSSGDIVFDIIPDDFLDADFLVFKRENNDCGTMEIVRCMATGQSVGDTSNMNGCIGSTGLLYGETDTVEYAGCSPTDNNYLAPLDVLEGEQYILMINDFSNSTGYDIDCGGTAEIDCMTTNTSDLKINDKGFFIKSSNPVSNELSILIGDNIPSGKLYLFNMFGNMIYNKNVRSNEMVNIQGLNVSGAHVAVLKTDRFITSKKVIFVN